MVGVANASMLPTYRHGDCLLVLYGSRRRRVGDAVVVRRPDALLVKRIAALPGDGLVHVRSDNYADGVDSRTFGSVPSADIVGRVLFRYWRHQRW